MKTLYSPSVRTERLIVIGRIILAVLSLLVLWLDPVEPSPYSAYINVLLTAYLGYALLMAALVWASSVRVDKIGLISHIIDIAMLTSLVYFTEGVNSPFFAYFVFAIFCAALRWQKQGTLWTALAFLCLFIGMGLSMEVIQNSRDFELNHFIIRSIYLTTIALLLVYLTTYEKRVRNELDKLHDWPSHTNPSAPTQTLIREALTYAAEVMNAPRLLMIWEEQEEPVRHIVYLSPEKFRWRQIPPDAYEPLIAEHLDNSDFLCRNAADASDSVLLTVKKGFRSWLGTPLHAELIARYNIRQVISVLLNGQNFHGRLLFLDKSDMTSDDLTLGGLVARQLNTLMDQLAQQQHLQKTAATEERIKMARDLHDGVLQTLTGIALQIETVKRQLDQDTPTAQQRLTDLQTIIVEEQRNLRNFIQKLNPRSTATDTLQSFMERRLNNLAETIRQQWSIVVMLDIRPVKVFLSRLQADDIHYLLREALVNSAKHAQASQVKASVAIEADQVNIHVEDNGQGFPFQGQYDLAGLTSLQLGPKTLRERIAALNGELIVHSSNAGARLEIAVPLRPHQDRASQFTRTDRII